MSIQNIQVQKQYKSKDNSITYGYSKQNLKWNFQIGAKTFLFKCSGAEVAHKVAGIVSGGWKRAQKTNSNRLDNMAIGQLRKINVY